MISSIRKRLSKLETRTEEQDAPTVWISLHDAEPLCWSDGHREWRRLPGETNDAFKARVRAQSDACVFYFQEKSSDDPQEDNYDGID